MEGCKYFVCQHLSEENECECDSGDCIGDMCDSFHDCMSCQKDGNEECPEY